MATGASTADLAVILIDARNGVLQQSRRHGFIASLLGIPNFVVAVNKMDAVDYDERVFRGIETEFREFVGRFAFQQSAPQVYFLPISALEGDNVVRPSRKMPWFEGPTLLEFLETVPVHHRTRSTPFRFPVQRVIRPDQDFRGYAGQVVSGTVRPGDGILALPSGRRSRVKSIETFDGQLEEAVAPMSVTVTLEDEVDISRGDMLASAQKPPEAARQFDASMVWLNEQPLELTRPYILKHTTQTLPAEVKAVLHRVNIKTLEHEAADRLEMNGIGVLRIETSRPIYFDAYTQNRATGSLILIDPETNATVGAGMILAPVIVERGRSKSAALDLRHERVTPVERIARYRHGGETVSLGDRKPLAWLLERKLFDRGCAVTVIEHAPPETLAALEQAGLLVLLVSNKKPNWDLPRDDSEAADFVIASLEASEVLLGTESLTGGEGI
jgi:sulfate adenylyltransferase subunit 1